MQLYIDIKAFNGVIPYGITFKRHYHMTHIAYGTGIQIKVLRFAMDKLKDGTWRRQYQWAVNPTRWTSFSIK